MTEFKSTNEMQDFFRNLSLSNSAFVKQAVENFEKQLKCEGKEDELIYNNAVFYLNRTKIKTAKNVFEQACNFLPKKNDWRDYLKYLYISDDGFLYSTCGTQMFIADISNHETFKEIKSMINWENKYIYMQPISKSYFPSNISSTKELNEYCDRIKENPKEHPLYGNAKFNNVIITAEKIIVIDNKFYAMTSHQLDSIPNFHNVINSFTTANKKSIIKLNDSCIETLASICKLNNIIDNKDYTNAIPLFTNEKHFIHCCYLLNALKCFDISKNIEIHYSNYKEPIRFQQNNITIYVIGLRSNNDPEKIKGIFDFFSCYPEDKEQKTGRPKQNKNSKQEGTKKVKQNQEEPNQKPEQELAKESKQEPIQESEQESKQEDSKQEESPVAIKETNSQETQYNNQEMEKTEMDESTKQNFKFELNSLSKHLLSFKQSMSYYGIKTYEPRIDFINRYYKKGICTTGTIVDKNGKSHFVVNGNFLGEECFKYALYLLTGGEIIEKL